MNTLCKVKDFLKGEHLANLNQVILRNADVSLSRMELLRELIKMEKEE